VQGAGARYVWTYVPSLVAAQAPDTYAIQYGDSTQAWEALGCVCTNFELSAALDEVVTIRADFESAFHDKISFDTPATSAFTEVVANKGKVWIDGTWANLGTTIKSAVIAGMTMRFPTGNHLVKYFDGGLEPSAVKQSRHHFELDLDLIMSANAITEYDAWAADTSRAIRITFTGPVIESSNTYKLDLSFFGKYTSEPELLDDRDGETMFRLTLSSFDDGSGNMFSAVVENISTTIATP
jgi:hypothetical protein